MSEQSEEWTEEDVIDLFNSGTTPFVREAGDDYYELAEYLNKGWIEAEECAYIPTVVPPLTDPVCPERAVFDLAFGSGSGGEAHCWLKWWAWNWLRERGEPDPKFEAQTHHGRADLMAPQIRCLVECGAASAYKVFRAFEAGACEVFALFPFVYEDEEHIAVLFRVTSEGQVALAERVRAQRARIKQAVDDM